MCFKILLQDEELQHVNKKFVYSEILTFDILTWHNGICNGLNGKIPLGSHEDPISIVGDKLLWEKAQKNEIKNNTSAIINKIIPHRTPLVTNFVCVCDLNSLLSMTLNHGIWLKLT